MKRTILIVISSLTITQLGYGGFNFGGFSGSLTFSSLVSAKNRQSKTLEQPSVVSKQQTAGKNRTALRAAKSPRKCFG